MGFMFWQSKEAADYERQRALEEALSGEESGTVASDTAPEVTLPVDAEAAPMLNLLVQEASVPENKADESDVLAAAHAEETVTLRNEYIESDFYQFGWGDPSGRVSPDQTRRAR